MARNLILFANGFPGLRVWAVSRGPQLVCRDHWQVLPERLGMAPAGSRGFRLNPVLLPLGRCQMHGEWRVFFLTPNFSTPETGLHCCCLKGPQQMSIWNVLEVTLGELAPWGFRKEFSLSLPSCDEERAGDTPKQFIS